MKETIHELGATAESSVRGSALSSSYSLEPVEFLKSVVDAGQKNFFFRQACKILTAPKGTKDVIQPKRTAYLGSSGVTFDSTTPTAGAADISQTTLNTLSSVTFTPAPYYAQVAIENYALSVNSLNLVEAAKDELIYAYSDKVDIAIATALKSSTNQSTSSARGAQIVYGGNARRDSELAAGDVITTDMVATGKRKLQSNSCKYWPDSAGSEAACSQDKNPWVNTTQEPFVLFIAPEQEEVFMKDSQFINASEYGSNDVVLNGEIGKYLGVKIVVTCNTPAVAASGASLDGESATVTVAMHRCILLKSQRAVGICYGIKETPDLEIFQWQNRDETRINLLMRYDVKVIHSDAICFIDVSQA